MYIKKINFPRQNEKLLSITTSISYNFLYNLTLMCAMCNKHAKQHSASEREKEEEYNTTKMQNEKNGIKFMSKKWCHKMHSHTHMKKNSIHIANV